MHVRCNLKEIRDLTTCFYPQNRAQNRIEMLGNVLASSFWQALQSGSLSASRLVYKKGSHSRKECILYLKIIRTQFTCLHFSTLSFASQLFVKILMIMLHRDSCKPKLEILLLQYVDNPKISMRNLAVCS